MVSQQKMLFLAAYVAAGIAFGMHMMEWTLTESAYWLTVTGPSVAVAFACCCTCRLICF
jgi:hypothetical protein